MAICINLHDCMGLTINKLSPCHIRQTLGSLFLIWTVECHEERHLTSWTIVRKEFQAPCLSIQKVRPVLLELGWMLGVSSLPSNLKQESPLQHPQEWAKGQVWFTLRESTSTPRNCKGLRRGAVIQAQAEEWVGKEVWFTHCKSSR